MKMRCVLLCFLFSFISVSVFAQADSLKTSRIYRNEIGADFLPIIKYGHSAGVLYRRHQQQAAWRIRLNGEFSSNNLLGGVGQVSVFETNARWGREWHLPYKKFQFYYGLDLLTGYRYNSSGSFPEGEMAKTHEATGGLMPLIGCTYIFDERFSASIETNGSYSVTMLFSNGNHWNDGRGILISGHALFLSYRF